MKELKGSEKQIAWAQNIINNALNLLDGAAHGVQTIETTQAERDATQTVIAKIKLHIDNMCDANEIIKNRGNCTVEALVETIKFFLAQMSIDTNFVEYIDFNKNNQIIPAKN